MIKINESALVFLNIEMLLCYEMYLSALNVISMLNQKIICNINAMNYEVSKINIRQYGIRCSYPTDIKCLAFFCQPNPILDVSHLIYETHLCNFKPGVYMAS